MRQIVFLSAWALACTPLMAGDDDASPAASKSAAKELFKPEVFETLVNPNCSHCVDEAKRRATQLRDDDRVLAWIRGKYEGGGIPWRFFLVPYRVISDTYGVFVYDADAGFVRGFEPSLDFKFHGWRNGVMVIRHKDGTLFSALSGRAFAGPRQGEQLKPIATLETDWGFWNAAYPGSVAYHMFEKYQPLELPGEGNADSASTRLEADPRKVAGQTRVVGLALGDEAKAWPLAAIEAAGGLIEDTLSGQKLLVLWYAPTQTAAVYAAEMDGEGDELKPLGIELAYDATSQRAPFLHRGTGSHWGIEGRAVDGPLKGHTLRWLPAVQCRWFAWAAEYPETKLHDGPRDTAPPNPRRKAPAAREQSQRRPAKAQRPFEAVIVEPDAVTAEHAAAWRRDGHRAVAVVLDESRQAQAFRRAAQAAREAQLDLYYWIEVARSPELAAAHPKWMAALGVHDDWHARFPDTPLPKRGEVAKAFPWVPIGYREAYDAHLKRIAQLLDFAQGDYRGLLLNDLQGGPASCGCGNLQCRWAIDYHVASTATKLDGDDVAARFIAEVRKLAPEKQVIPIWMTECEDRDLPADRQPGGRTTGYCGGVGCSQATCPQVFTKQWMALAAGHDAPLGLMVTHGELGREGTEYGEAAGWIADAVDYLEQVPPKHGGRAISRQRLWLVVQGYALPPDAVAAARRAALATGAGAVFVALTRLDQSYEPRVVDVE